MKRIFVFSMSLLFLFVSAGCSGMMENISQAYAPQRSTAMSSAAPSEAAALEAPTMAAAETVTPAFTLASSAPTEAPLPTATAAATPTKADAAPTKATPTPRKTAAKSTKRPSTPSTKKPAKTATPGKAATPAVPSFNEPADPTPEPEPTLSRAFLQMQSSLLSRVSSLQKKIRARNKEIDGELDDLLKRGMSYSSMYDELQAEKSENQAVLNDLHSIQNEVEDATTEEQLYNLDEQIAQYESMY